MPLAVCSTPIGNLEDVTLRVLRELAEAELVLCEDTRHTGKLLERHGIRARLLSYHEHNEAARTAEVLPRLQAGERIALASDAGLPAVSDPGARLIAAAIEVRRPGDRVAGAFGGRDGARGERARRRALSVRRLPASRRARAARPVGGTGRLAASSRGFRVAPSASRQPRLACRGPSGAPVAVCRELTKRFEEVVRGTAAEVAERYSEAPKGEITVVVGSAPTIEADDVQALEAVAELVAEGSGAVARRRSSRLTGVARNRLYRPSL